MEHMSYAMSYAMSYELCSAMEQPGSCVFSSWFSSGYTVGRWLPWLTARWGVNPASILSSLRAEGQLQCDGLMATTLFIYWYGRQYLSSQEGALEQCTSKHSRSLHKCHIQKCSSSLSNTLSTCWECLETSRILQWLYVWGLIIFNLLLCVSNFKY